jgi:hypothetical protein
MSWPTGIAGRPEYLAEQDRLNRLAREVLERTATGLQLLQKDATERMMRAVIVHGQAVDKMAGQFMSRRCICCGALWYEVEHD